ncbi:PREDICTED: uncharacterized protein LOC106115753 isoform X1 [Papilio xuthus]|uniref:Uncharacterized protein LOC106115753 isoform X1 n=1 Tax=Papilio xuthus TaxID=66420 RepID=A0AAJ6Z3L6_PAPXU|nr:PREDICTED: uncharacterized protein LOC106115753 isoform X1 [Papilio xuthus]
MFIPNTKWLVILTCLVGGAKYAYSIFCYDCNSAFDPRCGEEFDPFSLGVVNCSLKDPLEHIPPVESKFCRSIKMEIYGKVRVVRGCGFLTEENEKIGDPPCRRQTGTGDLFVTYCTCDTDLCNKAALNGGASVLALMLLSLFLVC